MSVTPSSIRRAALVTWLEPRRRLILLGMLVLLHLTLLEGVGSIMDKLLMVVHIGLFFLWQPFVRKEQQLSPVHLVLLAGVVAVMTLLQGTALMMVWCMLLGGIIGGKVFVLGSRWNRIFHLAALTYLLGALLLFLLPRLLPPTVAVSLPLNDLARFGLPLALLVMLVVPAEPDVSGRREVVDFAYSVFVFLLLAVLVLGSLSGMLLTGIGYVESLLAVLLTIAVVLLFLGWSWNPRAGFSGLGAFVARYLFSAGLPFELWVETLTTAHPMDDPEGFVTRSCNTLLGELGWVNGIQWSSESGRGEAGRLVGHVARFGHRGLTFDVRTNDPLTPAVVWQFNILLLLLDEFYLARVRERQLREIGFMQAVYETGSRLTHDVKNILQSLNALCAAAAIENSQGGASPEFQRLIHRQLPAIAGRLGQTLDKLGQTASEDGAVNDAVNWWRGVQDGFADRGIAFSTRGNLAGVLLPANLFSTVAENLIQNALDKRQVQTGLKIGVALVTEAGGLVLEVCDDGDAISERLASRIGISPVNSNNGLGIGLYQATRLASAAGYRLELFENAPGRVCFRLSRESVKI